jgi:hypothetical protein
VVASEATTESDVQLGFLCIRQHTSAYVSIRQHTSAYVSIRQHTSAYGSGSECSLVSYAARSVSICTVVPVKQVNLVPFPLPLASSSRAFRLLRTL